MLTKAQFKRRAKRVIAFFYRINLKNRNFSIISNNCWGGVVYDRYALPYLTPTIGLWIPPKDYVKFLSNIQHYLDSDIEQISYERSHVHELLLERKKTGRYNFDLDTLIIGRIDDIDIIFIHYNSFDVARDKWNRRKQRINWDNLLVKMNDQNGCTLEDVQQFLSLKYKNKLFFTSNDKWKGFENTVFIEKYKSKGYVVNDTSHGDVPINITRLLNQLK